MTSDVARLLFYLLLAIGVSFLCSMTESGLLSLSRSRVAMLVRSGRRSGKLLAEMKQNVDRPLAAILTLNTAAHTIGAAGVGAESLLVFGDAWVAASSAVLTLLILVFSEIIPKTIGVVHAGPLAPFTAYVVTGMIWLTYPVVVAFQALSGAISRGREERLTREEFALIAELGQTEGAIIEQEYRVIHNLLHLRKVRVHAIMTPRTVAFMLQKDETVANVLAAHRPLRFARIPIYNIDKDDPIGFVYRPELYEADDAGHGGRRLETLMKPVHAIPETATVSDALHQFIDRGEQLFVVVDEHGGTAGLVTLEDAIETLLGAEIVDERDSVADMRKLAGALFLDKLGGRKL
ncbi:MAG: HlyC/CorC family transporter [Phycisphaerae bacterium]|nr:HlyC/CorC family transporter [Phycisphaerae bacterium]